MTHNPIRPWRNIERRVSRQIRVGKVLVDAPVLWGPSFNTHWAEPFHTVP